MKTKKFAIGCLAVIGGIVVIVLIISLIVAITSTPDTEETPVHRLRVELVDAQEKGYIKVNAFGTGSPRSININISSQSDDLLEVAILPGTIFEPQEDGIQRVVITEERELSVEPYKSVEAARINVISMDMELDVASENNTLALNMSHAAGYIMELLNLDDFRYESSSIQQYAVWTITDNPARNQFVRVGARESSGSLYDEEIERIQIIFDKAGLPAEDFRLFQKPISVELTEANSRKLVDVNVYGSNSIDHIRMTVYSKSDDTLEVAILPGTIFAGPSAGVQNMVVTKEKLLLLYPYDTIGAFVVDAACANMRLGVPGRSDNLSMVTTLSTGDLMMLLKLPDFHKEIFNVRQFAIWTITDNPERNEYVGIGSHGSGRGPNDEEMERIRLLFNEAGISTDKYRALR